MVPESACCGTCESWLDVTKDKSPYGECQVAMIENGKAFTLMEASARGDTGPSLRCASSFVCSQYRGPYGLRPIAELNVDFKSEVTTMRDLARVKRQDWANDD